MKPSISCSAKIVVVGARASRLSRAQVREVHEGLLHFHPHIEFLPIWQTTHGDADLSTSLKSLGTTDFFTREIDQLLLANRCRISIHSAKDLPEPIMAGLNIVAVTKGIDPSDVLVLRANESIDSLPRQASIGSSSVRRDLLVKTLRADLCCVDIRGDIDRRLMLLDKCKIDGVVMAEAALIRLKLTHRPRIFLKGATAPLQGKLAILAREGDYEMTDLFACLDERR